MDWIMRFLGAVLSYFLVHLTGYFWLRSSEEQELEALIFQMLRRQQVLFVGDRLLLRWGEYKGLHHLQQ
jgi:hypothetical protein